MKKKKLKNEIEAIQDLIKGKQTTSPREHSGEGIFFTSKVADRLDIRGGRKKLIFDNIKQDIFIVNNKQSKGTKVRFQLAISTKRSLKRIFQKYTDRSLAFSKTEITVDLYKPGSAYISRSQARRVLNGLDRFKTIILNFKNIETVGQAFADEVFRVWQKRYPTKIIITKNANDNIMFMIKRALANGEK